MIKIKELFKNGILTCLMFMLSLQFISRVCAGKTDNFLSLKVLQEEAEKASLAATDFLKMLHEQDKELSEFDRPVFQWFRRATGPGDVIAQFHLGLMYTQGTLEKDEREARECFELAVREGTTIANFLEKFESDPTFTRNFPLFPKRKREEEEEKEE